MTSKELSKEKINLLKKAGWYEGRQVEIEEEVRLLEERGFEVSEKVKEYLREFNGIHIKIQDPYFEDEIDEHYIDVEDAMGDAADRYMVVLYEKKVKENLVFVGGMDNDNLILMISETGKVYCSVGKVGNDIWEAWNVILDVTGKNKVDYWQELREF
ncbi:MAG: hypothetical protein GX287_08345 [Fusobacteria bacterium]|nr:hypothetical protein [Fusobacteriota bacterium]